MTSTSEPLNTEVPLAQLGTKNLYALIASALGIGLSASNTSIVNTALPAITVDINASTTQWGSIFMTIAPVGCFVLLHSTIAAWTYLFKRERGPLARHLVRLRWLQPLSRHGLNRGAPPQLRPYISRFGRLPLSRQQAGARRRSDRSGVLHDPLAPHCAGRIHPRGNREGPGAPARVSISCHFAASHYLRTTLAMPEHVLTKLVTKAPL